MDITLLIALASVTLLILFSIGLFFNSRRPPKIRPEAENRGGGVAQRVRDGAPRRAQIARNRGVRMRANARQQQAESEEENDVVERDTNAELPDEKMGAKKRAKLEAKAEKKAQREVDEQQRLEKKKRDQQTEDERKKIEEIKQAEENRVEDEERRAKEDKEKREYEEYLKMKEAFSVEEEGYEEGDGDETQNLLQEFVNYIKTNKVVTFIDASDFFEDFRKFIRTSDPTRIDGSLYAVVVVDYEFILGGETVMNTTSYNTPSSKLEGSLEEWWRGNVFNHALRFLGRFTCADVVHIVYRWDDVS